MIQMLYLFKILQSVVPFTYKRMKRLLLLNSSCSIVCICVFFVSLTHLPTSFFLYLFRWFVSSDFVLLVDVLYQKY